jgi:serine/threonine-protein kinase
MASTDETERKQATFTFGEFRLDVAEHALYRRGKRVRIQRKPFEVLRFLVEQAPALVTREELLSRFWSSAVNDETLTRCVSTIRKLLQDSDDPTRLIETHRAEGYRFIADVTRDDGAHVPRPNDRRRGSRVPGILIAAGLAIAAVVGIVAVLLFARQPTDVPITPDLARFDRIAVMPIEGSGGGEPWLASAMTHHLLHSVSRIEGVTVVTIMDSGAEALQSSPDRLDVDAILYSRLEQLPEYIRLSSRLVATDGGDLIWSASVDSSGPSTEAAQVERIAREVALRLRPMLQVRAMPEPVDPEAYRHYLQGRFYWSLRSSAGLQASIEAFEAALDIEENYTDALIGAAESWLLLPLYGSVPPMEAIPKARQLAEQVLASEPDDPRALSVLGAVEMLYNWDWQRAEALFRRAVTLNPNDATLQQRLGELYCYRARFDDCRRQLRIALGLDPLSAPLAMQQGSVPLWEGNFELAVARYAEAIAENPDYSMAQYARGLAFAGLGRWEEAITHYEASLTGLGLTIVGGPMVFALARSGQTDAAFKLLQRLEALAAERYVPPSKLAVAYLGLGDEDRAAKLLRDAIAVHDDRLIYFGVDVHTRDLVENPRFRDIADQLGF